MTTDTQNNFYLTTTGSMEDPACLRRGSASVVLVPSSLTRLGNSFQSSSFSRPEDLAVNPATHDIYVTFTEDNTVVRFPALAPLSP
jgi:secreted PhoX family phosphatase